MRARIVRDGEGFLLEISGRKCPLYGYMTYLPHRGSYEDFARAGVNLSFVPVYMGDRGINQNTATRPFQPGFWVGGDEYDFSPVQRAFERAAAGGAYLIPRIMTEPPAWWDRAHPDQLCRSFQGEPAHASFSSALRHRDVTKALEAFWGWCRESGWDERIVGWHLAGGNTEEFLRPTPHPRFYADYAAPAVAAWREFAGKEINPPEPLERRYPAGGDVRDPEKDALAIRYYEFLSDSVARAIVALCREGKRITGGAIPMGAFYGYLVNVTDPELGHGAIARVLESEYVDFLASPFCYTGLRAPGVDWPIPGPAASARLHGKPWLIEADVRTCLTGPLKDACPQAAPKVNRQYEGGVWAGPDTEEKSLALMKKALGSILCSGAGAWWFDMWGGWYDSPAFMEFHEKACRLFAGARFVSRAQTAVVLDENLIYRDASGYAFRAHHDLLVKLAATGAAVDVYARSDLGRIDFARYRAVIFPGERGEMPKIPVALRIATGAGEDGVRPEKGEARFREPAPDSAALRDILLAAGAHIYSYTGDVCQAGGDFVCLHAAAAGVKRVYIPREGAITDAFTGETLNVSEAFAEFELEAGGTKLMRVEYREST